MGSGERYEVKSLRQAFEIVGDSNLEKIISVFEKDFSKIKVFSGIFIGKKEVLGAIKERVFDGIKDRYNDLKSRISYLRKHGVDISVVDFRLLQVPLKTKLLEVVFSMDNYRVVVEILNEVEEVVIKEEGLIGEGEGAEKRIKKKEGKSGKKKGLDKKIVKKVVKNKVSEVERKKKSLNVLNRLVESKFAKINK